MPRGAGTIQKKLMILLFGRLSLGFCYTPGQRARVLQETQKEWEKVNEESLRRAINGLYRNKLIDWNEKADGKITIKLNDLGKQRVLGYNLEEIKVKKPKKWDGKWRMVLFDIPNSKKKVREALRFHLRRLGFYPYQKSVFIHPFPCLDEVDFLIEFYAIRPYVRQLVISEIDNDFHLRKIFEKLFNN